MEWNRNSRSLPVLEKVFAGLNINSLLFCRPAEPYRTVIDCLAEKSDGSIRPEDCETRTFLHELPVTFEFDSEKIISLLKMRKCAVVPGFGIITYGTVSIEQAYVTFSSVCFACFVKFFSDCLRDSKRTGLDAKTLETFERACGALDPPPGLNESLLKGPFESENDILAAMDEAGKLTVDKRLVDSYFGNISYCDGEVLYISQTGSSLDDLAGCVDPCRLDGSSCVAITASSELTAHLQIARQTGARAILHGHPRFSVILSMDCDANDCDHRGECHKKCPRERFECGVRIVPGEVGTGPHGLCRTVPKAMGHGMGAIVHGHGIFTAGTTDFNDPFKKLLDIENACRREYFRKINL